MAAVFALRATSACGSSRSSRMSTPSKVAYDKSLRDIAGILRARRRRDRLSRRMVGLARAAALQRQEPLSRHARPDLLLLWRSVSIPAPPRINGGVFCQPRCAPTRRPAFRSGRAAADAASSSTRALSWPPRFQAPHRWMRKTPGVIERYRSTQHVLFELPRCDGAQRVDRCAEYLIHRKGCRVLLAAGSCLAALEPLRPRTMSPTVGDDSHDGTSRGEAWAAHREALGSDCRPATSRTSGLALYREQIGVLTRRVHKRFTFSSPTRRTTHR